METVNPWPQPITDRAPTQDDADEWGQILMLKNTGWTAVPLGHAGRGDAWLQTPSWRPGRWGVLSRALRLLQGWEDTIRSDPHEIGIGLDEIDLLRRALPPMEQADG